MKPNKITLLKKNDHRTDSDLEWITEFYEFLKGKVPASIQLKKGGNPKLNEKQAYSIIWYLQEHFPLLPDTIEQCDTCGCLYDSYSSGLYWETKGKHYCNGCEYLVPTNYDRGRK